MDRSPTLPLSAFIAITVIIGGFFWIKGPLESKRPAPAERSARAAFGLEDVEARLWQDPFTAVREHRDGPGHAATPIMASRHTLATLRTVIAGRDTVTVMPVLIPGGDYAEEVELRRRTRKAVVAALGVAGFVPEDAGHVGFVETRWLVDPATDAKPQLHLAEAEAEAPDAGLEVIVPHEWFSWDGTGSGARPRTAGHSEDILVIWLDEALMGGWVVGMLDQILVQLMADDPGRLASVPIIGPSSSTTVLGLMRRGKAAAARSDSLRRTDYPMTFFSCRSTASERLLLGELGIGESDTSFAGWFEQLVGAGFERSVATDDTLIATLFDELELRGVALADSDVHVALVGEWDTFYGRALPRSVRAQLARREGRTNDRARASDRLHQFSYLQGLDGILPGSEQGKASSGGQGGRGSATASTVFVPRPDDVAWPFGRNQLDNIQRLTVDLERLDDELGRRHASWRQPFKHGIDVIGVVGSDIYDKLLILQALTHRFPNAIFFTTDLDAQLLHPTQQSWSRNVIVVSSYGLSLGEKLQSYTLPFRDSYQTATYVSVLQAVNDEAARGDAVNDTLGHLRLDTRVFEIGRHGMVDLSPQRTSAIHPPFAEAGLRFGQASPRIGLVVVVLATLVAAILAFLFHHGVQRIVVRENPGAHDEAHVTPVMVGWTAGALLVGFLGLYVTSIRLWNAGGNEPLAALGGVSAWPIQYWRWSVLVLSVAFFFYAGRLLSAHVRRVEERFGLGLEATGGHASGAPDDLANTLRHWRKYKTDGSRRRRARRVALGLGIFAVFMAGLYLIYGLPPAPFRGRTIVGLHWTLLATSGLAVAAVTVFVLDAILLCWRRILTLAPAQSGWPARILRAYRNRLDVPDRVTEPLNQVLDLEIIADTTRVVGNLLRWPFLLLFMMILSRNTLHESWNLTPTLLYTYGALFTLALISAIGLRIQAGRARDHVRKSLRNWRCGIDPDTPTAADRLAMQAHGGDVPAASEGASAPAMDCSWIDRVAKHVEAMDKGAFAPWYRHPIIQSVLLPASGLLLITVTELIARSGP